MSEPASTSAKTFAEKQAERMQRLKKLHDKRVRYFFPNLCKCHNLRISVSLIFIKIYLSRYRNEKRNFNFQFPSF